MRRVLAVSALTLFNVVAANAALSNIDFEGVSENAVSVVSFAGVLAPLGITSSTITGATGGVTGVWTSDGTNPEATQFGTKSFTIGYAGTWTLTFGGLGIDLISMIYFDSEYAGFTASVYGLDGTTLLQTQNIDGGPGLQGFGLLSFSGLGAIGKFTITDVWDDDGVHNGGDNVMLDRFSVNTIDSPVPEPSTYMMIGSALAGLAALRRYRRS